jgi:hypothetical protein
MTVNVFGLFKDDLISTLVKFGIVDESMRLNTAEYDIVFSGGFLNDQTSDVIDEILAKYPENAFTVTDEAVVSLNGVTYMNTYNFLELYDPIGCCMEYSGQEFPVVDTEADNTIVYPFVNTDSSILCRMTIEQNGLVFLVALIDGEYEVYQVLPIKSGIIDGLTWNVSFVTKKNEYVYSRKGQNGLEAVVLDHELSAIVRRSPSPTTVDENKSYLSYGDRRYRKSPPPLSNSRRALSEGAFEDVPIISDDGNAQNDYSDEDDVLDEDEDRV